MDEARAVFLQEPPQKLHVAIVFEVEREPGHWCLGWPWDWARQNINAGAYAATCLHHRGREIAAATPELPKLPRPRAGVHQRSPPRSVLLSAGWQTDDLQPAVRTRILPAVLGQLQRERALVTRFWRLPGPLPWLRMHLPLCRHGHGSAKSTTWHATRTSGYDRRSCARCCCGRRFCCGCCSGLGCFAHPRHDPAFVQGPMAL